MLIHEGKDNCESLLASYLSLVSDYTLGGCRREEANLYIPLLCFAVQIRNIGSIEVTHPFLFTQFRHLNGQIPLKGAYSSFVHLSDTSSEYS